MNTETYSGRKRRHTKQVHIGNLSVGGDAPVSVQTMTKTDTRDIAATIAQIHEIELAGCDIVRVAVTDEAGARAIFDIKKEVKIPIVADIHFDHELALAAIKSGVDGLRINPGNIGRAEHVKIVVEAARERSVPIRIGVNSGSLEKDIERKYGKATPEALVESAMKHVRILEDMSYGNIKVSVKASDVFRTLTAYRMLADRIDYPLHLGVTEAGTFVAGTVRSAVAMGILLAEGIGDTIRVSLTDTPLKEVRVGQELLRCLGLRGPGASVISCPTCGRIQVDVVSIAADVEKELEKYYRENPDVIRPTVAVMGCMVNGPGEAREADIALAGGKGKFALYVKGSCVASVTEDSAVEALLEQVRRFSTR